MAAKKKAGVIVIPAIKKATAVVKIRGLTPIITHAWAPHIIQEMIDKRLKGGVSTTTKKTYRPPKFPEDEFADGCYWLSQRPLDEDGNPKAGKDLTVTELKEATFGVPAQGLKNAIVRAAKLVDGVDMTDMRQLVHIDETEFLTIKGPTPVMRTDMVRLNGKTPDVRHRPMFEMWTMEIPISYLEDRIGLNEVVNLINLAGYTVGLAEWRPECNGRFGRFEVVTK